MEQTDKLRTKSHNVTHVTFHLIDATNELAFKFDNKGKQNKVTVWTLGTKSIQI